jgi:hypothetical protein
MYVHIQMVRKQNAVFALMSLKHLHTTITINTVLYIFHIVTYLSHINTDRLKQMLDFTAPMSRIN